MLSSSSEVSELFFQPDCITTNQCTYITQDFVIAPVKSVNSKSVSISTANSFSSL